MGPKLAAKPGGGGGKRKREDGAGGGQQGGKQPAMRDEEEEEEGVYEKNELGTIPALLPGAVHLQQDALSEGAAADAEWRWPLGLWETEETFILSGEVETRVLSGKACACLFCVVRES